IVVNFVGVKQSGRLQAVIVSLVLLSLVVFIADGLTYVDQQRYHPFFSENAGGLLAATGFVFVSYAGVTKIASVAEEVEDPGRNIPMGILGSIGLMMLIYTLVVFVIIGVAPAEELKTSLTPMALAASEFVGRNGEIAIAVIAVLALTSMANAGILSSSRFPLAMSRDSLAPSALSVINEQFRTPVYAIGFTGAALIFLIVAVPVLQLAKLASAFQILVFAFENVALVAFREADLPTYEPEFIAPGYPWIQLVGILGGILLLTQMGWIPMAGAAALIIIGVSWYRVYGREKTKREGAALDAIRRGWTDRALERTRLACEAGGPKNILIPVGRPPESERLEEFIDLVRIGSDIGQTEVGRIQVVYFEEVPEQLDLEAATDQTPAEVEFEAESGELVGVDTAVEYGEIVTHDTKRSIASFVDHYDIDLVLGEWHPSRWSAELLGADIDWYMEHTNDDYVFVRNRGYESVDEITLVADQTPFDPLEVVTADAIARSHDATIQLISTLPESATREQINTTQAY
ncbi:MAG: APC family permease, partial [Halobacteriaceae archaeon]